MDENSPDTTNSRNRVLLRVDNLPPRLSDSEMKHQLFRKFKVHGYLLCVKVVGYGEERYGIIDYMQGDDALLVMENHPVMELFGRQARIRIIPESEDREDNELKPLTSEIDDNHMMSSLTMYVGNLPPGLKQSELRAHFQRYGEVLSVDMKHKDAPAPFCFVQFRDAKSIPVAIRSIRANGFMGKRDAKVGLGRSTPSRFIWITSENRSFSHDYCVRKFPNYKTNMIDVMIDPDIKQAVITFDTMESAKAALTSAKQLKSYRERSFQVDYCSNQLFNDILNRINAANLLTENVRSLSSTGIPLRDMGMPQLTRRISDSSGVGSSSSSRVSTGVITGSDVDGRRDSLTRRNVVDHESKTEPPVQAIDHTVVERRAVMKVEEEMERVSKSEEFQVVRSSDLSIHESNTDLISKSNSPESRSNSDLINPLDQGKSAVASRKSSNQVEEGEGNLFETLTVVENGTAYKLNDEVQFKRIQGTVGARVQAQPPRDFISRINQPEEEENQNYHLVKFLDFNPKEMLKQLLQHSDIAVNAEANEKIIERVQLLDSEACKREEKLSNKYNKLLQNIEDYHMHDSPSISQTASELLEMSESTAKSFQSENTGESKTVAKESSDNCSATAMKNNNNLEADKQPLSDDHDGKGGDEDRKKVDDDDEPIYLGKNEALGSSKEQQPVVNITSDEIGNITGGGIQQNFPTNVEMNNPVATVAGGEFPSFPQVNFSNAVPPGFAYGNCPGVPISMLPSHSPMQYGLIPQGVIGASPGPSCPVDPIGNVNYAPPIVGGDGLPATGVSPIMTIQTPSSVWSPFCSLPQDMTAYFAHMNWPNFSSSLRHPWWLIPQLQRFQHILPLFYPIGSRLPEDPVLVTTTLNAYNLDGIYRYLSSKNRFEFVLMTRNLEYYAERNRRNVSPEELGSIVQLYQAYPLIWYARLHTSTQYFELAFRCVKGSTQVVYQVMSELDRKVPRKASGRMASFVIDGLKAVKSNQYHIYVDRLFQTVPENDHAIVILRVDYFLLEQQAKPRDDFYRRDVSSAEKTFSSYFPTNKFVRKYLLDNHPTEYNALNLKEEDYLVLVIGVFQEFANNGNFMFWPNRLLANSIGSWITAFAFFSDLFQVPAVQCQTTPTFSLICSTYWDLLKPCRKRTIEFSVKYLGSVAVPQSKGIDVIKEAVQKLRFNLQLNRSHGYKLQKVLIQISIYGITLVDVKTKVLVCQHALHRISFCADDKQDKRVFAYIVKRSAESSEHDCHVFLCNKVAEEITLTVGEAFDLAYRRFLENNGRDLEVKKQLIILRKRVQELEEENSNLKHQLAEQQRRSDVSAAVKTSGLSNGVVESDERSKRPSKAWESFDDSHNPVKVPPLPTSPVPPPPPSSPPPPLPARPSLLEKSAAPPEPFTADPFVVIDPLKHPLEALVKATGPLQPTKIAPTSAATVYDPEFDPRAEEQHHHHQQQQQQQQCYPLLASSSSCLSDLLGDLDLMGQSAMISSSDPATASSGAGGPLNNNNSNVERMMTSKPSAQMYDQAIRQIDLRLADLREGFSQGISFGKDDFHAVAELDSSLLNNGTTGPVGEKAA
ncbi:PTB domain-containing engulfment adapter protein [Trichinella spiralis]|uniref:PTB domain-containing engulfment adapter protein n=1 Tax=Trichinella spiralis TaxID=6334 RepID=A0ABR3KF06_TRISP